MIIFILLQLPFLVVAAYYLNSKKIYTRSSSLFLMSFLEGLGAFLVILPVLLAGTIANPLLKILLLTIGFTIIVFSNNNINESQPEMDLQLETSKNLFVLFSSTLLLFYIMLSVFRFQVFYLQILYSLIIVVLFNIVTIFLKRLFSKLYDRVEFNMSMFVNHSAIYIYSIALLLVLMIVFINFPKVSVNTALNLNNSNTYFSYPNGSVDLPNRYRANQLFSDNLDTGLDLNAYINQDDKYIYVYAHNQLLLYDLIEKEIIYSGDFINQVEGHQVIIGDQEENELTLQTFCFDLTECEVYTYPYIYGDVKYKTSKPIVRFDNLQYKESSLAIYNENILHFFKDEQIDSRLTTSSDKPLLGFGESNTFVTDMDNLNGSLVFLQVEEVGLELNIQVYEIVEEDIDLILPFYSHYRFGMLVFVFLLGFIPITNYDVYRNQ